MLPALEPGDLLLVDKRAYLGTEPHRGDIVCFRRGGEQLVKRIVGLPGEELEMIEGVIYVNGTLLVEPWLPGRPSLIVSGFISKGTLFESRFAILGDNRVSPLLTETPILPKDQIIGKVVRSFHFGPKHSSIKSTAAKRLSSTKQMH
jgi:signal peptidase I